MSKDPFIFSPTGAKVKPGEDVAFEDWHEQIRRISMIERSHQFWLGDLLNLGEDRFSDQATQVINDLGLAYGTLADMKWVCGKVPRAIRQEKLSFQHHRNVASLEVKDQDSWLKYAVKNNLSSDALRQEIKIRLRRKNEKEAAKEEVQESAESSSDRPEGGRYKVILVNPPWKEVGAETLEKIKLPAEQDSVLFLVTGADTVRAGILLLESWNFAFETTAVIDYGSTSAKFWFSCQHAIVMVGTRGSVRTPPGDRVMSSVLHVHPSRREKFGLYDIIDNMFPSKGKKATKCDMFGTNPRSGWVCLGNEMKEAVE